ncbi:MAG: DUF1849 family protein [Marivibrio sp.]|uniref:EipB family protein n=1 Tax=Marivibrio sp. TaxID=2039719 RepID=UPI0032EF0056
MGYGAAMIDLAFPRAPVVAFALAGSLALLLCLAPPVAGARAADLTPHEARYDLSLLEIKGANTGSAGGVFLVRIAKTCAGWRLDTDLQAAIETEDQGEMRIANRSRYDETIADDGAGGTLAFRQRQEINGRLFSETRGDARRSATGGVVEFERPRGLTLDLPAGVQFPVSGALVSMRGLFDGERLVSQRLFDGGEEGAMLVVDLAAGAPEAPTGEIAGDAELAQGRMLRAVTSFFPLAEPDSAPVYTYIGDLFENGVTGRMTLDLGLAVMEAELTAVRRLEPPGC